MRTFLDGKLKGLGEFFGRMTKKDKRRLGFLVVLVIVLAVVVVTLLSRTNYVLLYTAPSMAEAGAITEALQAIGEPYRIEGTRILVDENRVGDLRATLATQNLIGASGISHALANTHLIVIAIHNATGVWVDPPATPDKVLKALGKLT